MYSGADMNDAGRSRIRWLSSLALVVMLAASLVVAYVDAAGAGSSGPGFAACAVGAVSGVDVMGLAVEGASCVQAATVLGAVVTDALPGRWAGSDSRPLSVERWRCSFFRDNANQVTCLRGPRAMYAQVLMP